MTYEQFKTICKLAELLTDIQYGVITKSQMMDYCDEFYIDCDDEDDHFYAILADGRTVDKEYEPCKKSELRNAYKITYTSGWGTVWYFSNSAKKDGKLLEEEVETEIMNSLEEWIDTDIDYSAEELIFALKKAIAEKDN